MKEQKSNMRKHVKKLQWHTSYGKIEVIEQTLYRPNRRTLRPFSLSAGVTHHYYSFPLQRILVDFGAEEVFNRVHDKLKEHYGISLPKSAPRTIILRHAVQIETIQEDQRGHLEAPSESACDFGNGWQYGTHRQN